MISSDEICLQLRNNQFQRNPRWLPEEIEPILSIVEGFASKKNDSGIQEKAIQGLRLFPEPRVETLILELLNRSCFEQSCLETLAYVGNTKSLNILSRFLQSEKFTLRWEASDALTQICRRLSLPYPEESFTAKVNWLRAQLKNYSGPEPIISTLPVPTDLEKITSRNSEKRVIVASAPETIELEPQINFQVPVFTFHCFLHCSQKALFFCSCCSQLLCEICGISQGKQIFCERCFLWKQSKLPKNKL